MAAHEQEQFPLSPRFFIDNLDDKEASQSVWLSSFDEVEEESDILPELSPSLPKRSVNKQLFDDDFRAYVYDPTTASSLSEDNSWLSSEFCANEAFKSLLSCKEDFREGACLETAVRSRDRMGTPPGSQCRADCKDQFASGRVDAYAGDVPVFGTHAADASAASPSAPRIDPGRASPQQMDEQMARMCREVETSIERLEAMLSVISKTTATKLARIAVSPSDPRPASSRTACPDRQGPSPANRQPSDIDAFRCLSGQSDMCNLTDTKPAHHGHASTGRNHTYRTAPRDPDLDQGGPIHPPGGGPQDALPGIPDQGFLYHMLVEPVGSHAEASGSSVAPELEPDRLSTSLLTRFDACSPSHATGPLSPEHLCTPCVLEGAKLTGMSVAAGHSHEASPGMSGYGPLSHENGLSGLSGPSPCVPEGCHPLADRMLHCELGTQCQLGAQAHTQAHTHAPTQAHAHAHAHTHGQLSKPENQFAAAHGEGGEPTAACTPVSSSSYGNLYSVLWDEASPSCASPHALGWSDTELEEGEEGGAVDGEVGGQRGGEEGAKGNGEEGGEGEDLTWPFSLEGSPARNVEGVSGRIAGASGRGIRSRSPWHTSPCQGHGQGCPGRAAEDARGGDGSVGQAGASHVMASRSLGTEPDARGSDAVAWGMGDVSSRLPGAQESPMAGMVGGRHRSGAVPPLVEPQVVGWAGGPQAGGPQAGGPQAGGPQAGRPDASPPGSFAGSPWAHHHGLGHEFSAQTVGMSLPSPSVRVLASETCGDLAAPGLSTSNYHVLRPSHKHNPLAGSRNAAPRAQGSSSDPGRERCLVGWETGPLVAGSAAAALMGPRGGPMYVHEQDPYAEGGKGGSQPARPRVETSPLLLPPRRHPLASPSVLSPSSSMTTAPPSSVMAPSSSRLRAGHRANAGNRSAPDRLAPASPGRPEVSSACLQSQNESQSQRLAGWAASSPADGHAPDHVDAIDQVAEASSLLSVAIRELSQVAAVSTSVVTAVRELLQSPALAGGAPLQPGLPALYALGNICVAVPNMPSSAPQAANGPSEGLGEVHGNGQTMPDVVTGRTHARTVVGEHPDGARWGEEHLARGEHMVGSMHRVRCPGCSHEHTVRVGGSGHRLVPRSGCDEDPGGGGTGSGRSDTFTYALTDLPRSPRVPPPQRTEGRPLDGTGGGRRDETAPTAQHGSAMPDAGQCIEWGAPPGGSVGKGGGDALADADGESSDKIMKGRGVLDHGNSGVTGVRSHRHANYQLLVCTPTQHGPVEPRWPMVRSPWIRLKHVGMVILRIAFCIVASTLLVPVISLAVGLWYSWSSRYEYVTRLPPS
eukprot:jgi/Mesvir1/28321/Mv04841-RA.1